MTLVIIRGGGDLASGIAHRLFMAGFRVVILELETPLSIRRAVSFSEAVYSKEVVIEGVKSELAKDLEDLERILEQGNIPVFIDGEGKIIKELKPLAVVDAILAKVNLGTTLELAPITIGVGPGFEAGVDVNVVVETKEDITWGKVITKGKAAENTGIPGLVMGYGEERVIRAPESGVVKAFYNIGDRVEAGNIICSVGNERVAAQISGVLRGMIKEGLFVNKGLKIGDIDPRSIQEHAFTISDKARAIGGGVLEGILNLRRKL